jgi:hypothetical protein
LNRFTGHSFRVGAARRLDVPSMVEAKGDPQDPQRCQYLIAWKNSKQARLQEKLDKGWDWRFKAKFHVSDAVSKKGHRVAADYNNDDEIEEECDECDEAGGIIFCKRHKPYIYLKQLNYKRDPNDDEKDPNDDE